MLRKVFPLQRQKNHQMIKYPETHENVTGKRNSLKEWGKKANKSKRVFDFLP